MFKNIKEILFVRFVKVVINTEAIQVLCSLLGMQLRRQFWKYKTSIQLGEVGQGFFLKSKLCRNAMPKCFAPQNDPFGLPSHNSLGSSALTWAKSCPTIKATLCFS